MHSNPNADWFIGLDFLSLFAYFSFHFSFAHQNQYHNPNRPKINLVYYICCCILPLSLWFLVEFISMSSHSMVWQSPHTHTRTIYAYLPNLMWNFTHNLRSVSIYISIDIWAEFSSSSHHILEHEIHSLRYNFSIYMCIQHLMHSVVNIDKTLECRTSGRERERENCSNHIRINRCRTKYCLRLKYLYAYNLNAEGVCVDNGFLPLRWSVIEWKLLSNLQMHSAKLNAHCFDLMIHVVIFQNVSQCTRTHPPEHEPCSWAIIFFSTHSNRAVDQSEQRKAAHSVALFHSRT